MSSFSSQSKIVFLILWLPFRADSASEDYFRAYPYPISTKKRKKKFYTGREDSFYRSFQFELSSQQQIPHLINREEDGIPFGKECQQEHSLP
jgi:hypothetical protein